MQTIVGNRITSRIVLGKTRKKKNVPGNTHYLHTNYTHMLTVIKCLNRFTPNKYGRLNY